MALTNTAEVTLNINSQNAKARLEELQKITGNLSEAIKKAYDAGDTKTAKALTAEWKKANKEIAAIQKNSDNLNAAMKNLSTATPKELRNLLKQINRELDSGNVQRGSAAWNAYNQQLVKVNTELAKIKAEQKAALPLTDRLASAFGRLKGLAIAGGVGIAGLGAAISKMKEYRDEKDTSRAGLQALTGLDDSSVEWLQQQAEQMSQAMDSTGLRVTQSASEIMEAYKLVGSAKPELLAVKEDLNAVTVEAIRLSQAAGIDLNQAVEAVTTSMNQFGASAEETDRYVNVLAAGSKVGAVAVENINAAVLKAGVAASQAGLSIEELVGSIETIGERGLQGARAGTGLKSFFLELVTGADETNPKVVGLQQALENLAAQNLSEAEMLKRFGAEAYNVAAILTQSTDQVKKYTDGVTGTQTAVEQAARMGQTFAAESAQLKNQLAELGQEIFKSLQPAITGFMSKTTGVLKVIGALIKVIKDYGLAIAAIVAPLVAYNVALAVTNALHSQGVVAMLAYIKALFSMTTLEKAATAAKYLFAAATALMTGNIKRATIAFKLFSKALAASPIGLIAAGIAAVVVGLIAWSRRAKELTAEQIKQNAIGEMNAELAKKVNDETAEEISRIEKLKTAIHNKNLSEKARKEAIEALQKIIPAYNAEISKEGEIVNENTAAIEAYIVSLKKAAMARAANQMLTEVTAQKMNVELALDKNRQALELERQAYEAWEKGLEVTDERVQAIIDKNAVLWGSGYHMKAMRQLEKENKTLLNQLTELNAKESELLKKIAADQVAAGGVTATGEAPTSTGSGGDRKDQLAALEQQAAKARLAIEKDFAAGRTLYSQYKKDLLDVDKWLIGRQQALFTASEKEYTEYEQKKLELADKYKALENELLVKEGEEQTQAVQLRYAKGLMATSQYQAKLLDIELKTLQRRLELYQENSEEYAALKYQIEQKQAEQEKQTRAMNIAELEEEYKELGQKLALARAKGEMSEQAYNEAVHQAEIAHLLKVRDAYVEFSDDYIATQKKIEDAEAKHQQELAKLYADGLRNFNANYTTKVAEQEYAAGVAQIDEMLKRGDVSLENAARAKSDLAQKLLDAEVKQIENTNLSIIDSYKARFEAIERLEQQGVIDHNQAEQAKLKATTDMLNNLQKQYGTAWQSISSVMSAASQLQQANADLETAKVEAAYEARIEAAGRHSRQVARLEKERDREVAKIKNAANQRSMKVEIAQAMAQTASSAINAYSSAAAIPVTGFVLAPIAAAAALAAGAMQIAAIKKQHQAEAVGYATGGFTPSGRWDQEQGVVHSNEFVANRFAVGNREILPALQLIDRAQKNNTIGSLTAEDVSASLHTHASPDVVSAVKGENSAAMAATANAVAQTAATLERLNDQLEQGITAYASISGKQGIAEQTKKYNQLINNAR